MAFYRAAKRVQNLKQPKDATKEQPKKGDDIDVCECGFDVFCTH